MHIKHRGFSVVVGAIVATAHLPVYGLTQCAAGNPDNSSVVESTPTSAFVNNGDGTVTHTLTGLMWRQCLVGVSGPLCTAGAPVAMTWASALTAAGADVTANYVDWRLPTIRELTSIVERCGYSPAVNNTIFPGASDDILWSGTTFLPAPYNAWSTNTTGLISANPKVASFYFRLVRSGRGANGFDARIALNCTADIDGNGTYDALTDGLLLMRALFGLTGTAVTNGALGQGATRNDWTKIRNFMNANCSTNFAP